MPVISYREALNQAMREEMERDASVFIMIGPAVTDLIAELTLAKTTEVNAESLVYTIHAHPTFAEAIKGASEEAFGHAIDL